MNKKVIIGIIVAAVVILGGAIFIMNSKPAEKSPDDSATSQTANTKLAAVKACELLTLTEAKQLMGEATTEGSNTAPASSDDVSVDSCSYTNNATSVPAIRTVTVMARSALTNDGLDSNKEAFESGGAANPSGAVAVDGYGEKAFWDATTHQLAVLNDNTWIGIVYGGTNPSGNTLEDAKKAADLVVK